MTELAWLDSDRSYQLALDGDKLVCRNPKGKQLAQLPKWLKEGELAMQLLALRDWLAVHEENCRGEAERWLLRSLPVPRDVLAGVWADPSWSDVLRNVVVTAVGRSTAFNPDKAGFLREVTAKGVGVVDLDGETQWLKAKTVVLPHPILIDELEDYRELATELDLKQRLEQLYRETWTREANAEPDGRSIDDFSGGKFEQLNHAVSLCRRLGYPVRGGSAACRVWENGTLVEARYWLGMDAPEYEAWTGELCWVDARERMMTLGSVGPVAYSEGMRMAASIWAKRVVKDEAQGE